MKNNNENNLWARAVMKVSLLNEKELGVNSVGENKDAT